MDEVIKQVCLQKGYNMGNHDFAILCYIRDAVMIAENEDDIQRLMKLSN